MMKIDRARRLFSPSLKALVLLLGFMGQYFSLRGSSAASGTHFLYYTNISNILVSLLAAVLLVLDVRAFLAKKVLFLPRWLQSVRYALTAGILLTFVVFSLLLTPKLPLKYLASPSNLLLHNLVPLLACLDFTLFSHNRGERQAAWPGFSLPLAYFILVMGFMFFGIRFNGSAAPYFFLDFHANGWFTLSDGKLGVFWWLLILTALMFIILKTLLGLQRLVDSRTVSA